MEDADAPPGGPAGAPSQPKEPGCDAEVEAAGDGASPKSHADLPEASENAREGSGDQPQPAPALPSRRRRPRPARKATKPLQADKGSTKISLEELRSNLDDSSFRCRSLPALATGDVLNSGNWLEVVDQQLVQRPQALLEASLDPGMRVLLGGFAAAKPVPTGLYSGVGAASPSQIEDQIDDGLDDKENAQDGAGPSKVAAPETPTLEPEALRDAADQSPATLPLRPEGGDVANANVTPVTRESDGDVPGDVDPHVVPGFDNAHDAALDEEMQLDNLPLPAMEYDQFLPNDPIDGAGPPGVDATGTGSVEPRPEGDDNTQQPEPLSQPFLSQTQDPDSSLNPHTTRTLETLRLLAEAKGEISIQEQSEPFQELQLHVFS